MKYCAGLKFFSVLNRLIFIMAYDHMVERTEERTHGNYKSDETVVKIRTPFARLTYHGTYEIHVIPHDMLTIYLSNFN